MTHRILVTGSRTWPDRDVVLRELTRYCTDNGLMLPPDEYGNTLPSSDVVLVHGNAAGVDTMAEDWAIAGFVRIEVHPADWARHLKDAGIIRNNKMIALGADACLAFIAWCERSGCFNPDPHGTHGAAQCASAALAAGIPTWTFRP